MLKITLLTLFSLLLSGCESTSVKGVNSKDLDFISNLQKGGYVIFFRHAATDHSKKDSDLKNPTNCDAQRRLSGLGRTQSKVIGKSFKKLKIPVGSIVTSVYCRCVNTAQLAFGRAESTLAISSFVGLPVEQRLQRIKSLRDILSIVPSAGTNTVIVGHNGMFKEVAGVSLQEGEAAIFKPDGDGEARLVTQVLPNGWQKVGKNYSKL